MHSSLTTLLIMVLLLPAVSMAAAPAPSAGAVEQPLAVATRHVPPFAIHDAGGGWSGIAVDLWRRIADEMGVQYRFVETPLTEMLDAVADGRADAAAAALTITSERETRVDFSHPFHTSGLGIAVSRQPGGMLATLKRVFSSQFLNVAAALLGLLTAVGVLIWLAERRRNEQFHRDPVRGIGAGVWWSAVTMTTVGYGDKAPATLAGRAIGMIWMFAGIIIISSFTAAIATALTVGELDTGIGGLEDLYGARVLTLQGSTSQRFLDDNKIGHRTTAALPEALRRLADGDADAVVYDAPILRYLINRQYADTLRVLPRVLQRQDYGIALPQGSAAREQVNEALLRIIRGDDWPAVLEHYLGTAD